MEFKNNGTIVSVSKLEEYGRSFLLGEFFNPVQRERPSVTQPQRKGPSVAPEIKPPKPHSWLGLHSHEPAHRLLDHGYKTCYSTLLTLVQLRPMLAEDNTYLAASVSGRLHVLWRGVMSPHVVDAEVIQHPVPSYGIKGRLGADDGSMLWPVPDFEHALTGIAENRVGTRMQLSLDIF